MFLNIVKVEKLTHNRYTETGLKASSIFIPFLKIFTFYSFGFQFHEISTFNIW